MQTVIITNISGTPQLIADLGKLIQIAEEITLSDYFSIEKIASSDDLKELILTNKLSVNNGVQTLSQADALDYVTLDDLYTPDADFTGDAFNNLILTNSCGLIFTNSLNIVVQE